MIFLYKRIVMSGLAPGRLERFELLRDTQNKFPWTVWLISSLVFWTECTLSPVGVAGRLGIEGLIRGF